MTSQAEPSEQQRITHLVHEIEMLRLKRKRSYTRHPEGKRFSQDELCNTVYPSYKNMLLGRTQRLPDRAALMQIADYLECTPAERNALLRAAQYAPEDLPDQQRRKQTTILMGSVFVTLPAALDLEDAAEIMRSLWERLETIIVAHRGTVAERTGNILLALWSAETTSEDDPEQAIRAALAMQAELQALNAESRIGIHTGQALLQTTGKYGQMQASGDAVNIASHLSHLGPPNSILISQATYSQLRALFDVTPIETPLQTPIYRVDRISPVSVPIMLHGIQEVETPLVGRETELRTLQKAFQTVRTSGSQQILTILAEAGIGKSRLLYEFDGWLERSGEPCFRFKGRASQSSQEIPYSLLRSILSFRFHITDDDFSEIARQKIENGMAEVFPDAETAQRAAHIISHLLSFNLGDSPHVRGAADDAQEFFELALAFLYTYFKTISDTTPVVLMLDDLHWADDSSLILFNRLSSLLANAPVLILCAARPGLSDQRSYLDKTITLDLRPLSPPDSHVLLAELLPNVAVVPELLRDLIVHSSGGNPLYIEELVRMLMENGTLFRRDEQWIVDHEQLSNVQVPTTLTALLQTRFDNLSSAQQLLLQLASVFGRVFWDGGVKYLQSNTASEPENLPFSALMEELCHQKMIFRQGKSSFRGYTEYTFKHVLLSDVIYETILKQNRLAYHAAAARWLTTVASKNQRVDEYAGLIAYHLKCADIAEEASTWYRRAGKAAAARFANNEALAYLTCALDLLPPNRDMDRYTLLALRERVHDALGLRDGQAADLNSLFELTRAMGNAYLQVEVIVRQTNYAYLMGNSAEVARLAQDAIHLAQAIGANGYQASSYVMLGNVLWDQGDYEAAHACYEHALRLASLTGTP